MALYQRYEIFYTKDKNDCGCRKVVHGTDQTDALNRFYDEIPLCQISLVRPVEGTGNCYFGKFDDGDEFDYAFRDSEVSAMMREVSSCYAFSDIDDSRQIEGIYLDGRPVEYQGWAPAMYFEYDWVDTPERGAIAWDAHFPEFNH